MIGIASIIFLVLSLICFIIGFNLDEDVYAIGAIICLSLSVMLLIFGCFHGFINHPATEGSQIGIITAVDLEGVWFRRYEVYIKSSGYTLGENGFSEETKYLIYEYEEELAEQLKNYLGKKVKLNYGHDGGYIGWRSCGKYHIKSVELIEGE